jgi:hypothetical protein
MSDETHPDIERLKASLRAVTSERDRYKQEASTWQNAAATFEQQVAALSPFKEQVTALQGELKQTRTTHEQDLTLTGMGITSTRARRAIRREYGAELAELGEGAEPPPFETFVESLKGDQFFGRLFSAPEQTAEAAASRQPVKPAVNPNAGTGQPKAPDTPLDLAAYQEVRSRQGPRAASALLEQLKKQGIVS